MNKVTIFKNGYDTTEPHYITVSQALSRIKKGASKELVNKIREAKKDKKKYDKLKMELPSVIFAGKGTKAIEKTYQSGRKKGQKYVSYRDDESITSHSSFLILDFDHIESTKKIQQLKNDEYIYSAWISPSCVEGVDEGVKALVHCPPDLENHSAYYESFCARYPELDTTSKNISRLCFESYDPNIFIRPIAKVWDKKLSKQATERVNTTRTEQHNNRIMAIAAGMIRAAADGTKHDVLLKASKLCGGYIAVGRLDETLVHTELFNEVNALGIEDAGLAKKTISDGIEYGKRQPIQEIKKIEKAQTFLKREDGTYDFLASKKDMDWYEEAFLNGTLPMGLPTGLNELDKYWMFKHNTLVWFVGIDNTGKSFVMWYLAVLQSIINGKKFLLYSAENSDGEVRKKLKEMFLGDRLDMVDSEQRKVASDWVDEHFKIMTSKKMYTLEQFLMRVEIVFDEGWEYDCVIGDPFNAFDVPTELSGHVHNVKGLNMLRVFKENYSSVWIADHAGSNAARNKDSQGYIKVPWKSETDGGQIKANKVDDFIVIHRLANHPDDWMITEMHVQKIKSTETGGSITQKDNPFRMVMNTNKCGYHQIDNFDPVKEFWAAMKGEETVHSSISPNTEFETKKVGMLDAFEKPPY